VSYFKMNLWNTSRLQIFKRIKLWTTIYL